MCRFAGRVAANCPRSQGAPRGIGKRHSISFHLLIRRPAGDSFIKTAGNRFFARVILILHRSAPGFHFSL
jgi:hypothetical protein